MNEQSWVHLNLILVTGMDSCAGSFATAFSKQIVMGSVERDNGNDHRAGTEYLNIEKHAQVRLRVQYARHGRDLMGCKSPVHSFGFFIESHYTKM